MVGRCRLRGRPARAAAAALSAVPRAAAGRDEQLGQIFRNMRVAMKRVARDASRAASPPRLDHRRLRGRRRHRPAALEGDRADRARLLRAAAPRPRADPVAHPQPAAARASQAAAAGAAAPAAAAGRGRRPPAPARVHAPRTQARTRRAARGRRPGAHAVRADRADVLLAGAVYAGAAWCRSPSTAVAGLLPAAGRSAGARRPRLSRAADRAAPRRAAWIEVGDPQLRKADKLQTSTR